MRKGITKLVKNPDGTLTREYDMQKIFGKGYNEILWVNIRDVRYRVAIGARASKKSYNFAYEAILRMMEDPECNVLFVRRYDTDLRQSCFASVVRAISDLGLEDFFSTTLQPLKVTCKLYGTVILFRGLSSPTSLTSIQVEKGTIKALYVEEAWEIENAQSFAVLDQSIRSSGATYNDDGELVEQHTQQMVTLMLNPWNKTHWIYEQFFKNRLEPTVEELEKNERAICIDRNYVGGFGTKCALAVFTYKINEFRDKTQIDVAAEQMKKVFPDMYATVFLGRWGATGELTYPTFSDKNLITTDEIRPMPIVEYYIGIDTGLSHGTSSKRVTVKKDEDAAKKVRSATAMELVAITSGYKKLLVVDEYYHSNDSAYADLNTDNKNNMNIVELAEACVDKLIEWRKIYGYAETNNNNLAPQQTQGNYGNLLKGSASVYIDNADLGFRTLMELKAKERGVSQFFEFFGSTKRPIRARIDFTNLMLSLGDLLICKNCKNLISEIKGAHADKNGDPRQSIGDHSQNSYEYAMSPAMPSFSAYKIAFGKETDSKDY